jgi:hypothetical protein
VTISYWESVAAMSRFTGDDPTRTHHLPRDAELLTELPRRGVPRRARVASATPSQPAPPRVDALHAQL